MIADTITGKIAEAMKAKDEIRLSTLRLLSSALSYEKNRKTARPERSRRNGRCSKRSQKEKGRDRSISKGWCNRPCRERSCGIESPPGILARTNV